MSLARTVKLDALDYSLAGKYSKGERVMVECSASLAALTITLPDAGSAQETFKFVKTDSTTNTVTIQGRDSQTVSGTTAVLYSQYATVVVDSDGSNWISDRSVLI